MVNKFKINKTLILNNLKVIKEYIKEGTFIIDNGLKFCEIDPTNVALLSFDISKRDFLLYDDMKEKNHFSLNIEEYFKVLNLFDDAEISFYLDSENIYINDSETNIKIKLIEKEQSCTKIPDLSFSFEYKLNTEEFLKKILKNKGTDTLYFESNNKNFILSSKTNTSNIKFNFKNHKCIKDIEDNKYIINYSKYSQDYLLKLKNIKKMNKELKINFGVEYPLMIEINNLKFILAPRILND